MDSTSIIDSSRPSYIHDKKVFPLRITSASSLGPHAGKPGYADMASQHNAANPNRFSLSLTTKPTHPNPPPPLHDPSHKPPTSLTYPLFPFPPPCNFPSSAPTTAFSQRSNCCTLMPSRLGSGGSARRVVLGVEGGVEVVAGRAGL